LRRIAEFRESSSFRTHIALRESGVCLAERPMPHPPPPIAAPGVNPFWGTNARACIIVVCRRTPRVLHTTVSVRRRPVRVVVLCPAALRAEKGGRLKSIPTTTRGWMTAVVGENRATKQHTPCVKSAINRAPTIYMCMYIAEVGRVHPLPIHHLPPSLPLSQSGWLLCVCVFYFGSFRACFCVCVRARVVWPATPARRPTHRHLNPVHP